MRSVDEDTDWEEEEEGSVRSSAVSNPPEEAMCVSFFVYDHFRYSVRLLNIFFSVSNPSERRGTYGE
jgi:hypothetical protein